MTALRKITPLDLPGLPSPADLGAKPKLVWVNPRDLYVDETYQRDVSERSVRLVRKVAEGFRWSRMKPPVVVETGEGLHIIDGQHTAIAAATIGVASIPVFVVEAESLVDRARSFVAHNRDRIAITPLDVYRALVAAGDADALDVANVCRRAGVRLRIITMNSKVGDGDTSAIGRVRALVKKRGVMKARRILEALAKAKCPPVLASQIDAAENILCVARPQTELDWLTAVVRMDGQEGVIAARTRATREGLPVWRALADRWLKRLDGGKP